MSSPEDIFRKLLKQHGYSLTQPRRAVFAALLDQPPLPMNELIKRAGKVDRASVYRSVELFEKLGITQRINIGWKYKVELSDAFVGHHHHLSCLRCGKTIPMSEHELEETITRLASAHQFRPQNHQIEIQGYCKDCDHHQP